MNVLVTGSAGLVGSQIVKDLANDSHTVYSAYHDSKPFHGEPIKLDLKDIDQISKTIKVSTKGQIALPSDIQKELGLKKGDDILLIKKGRRILIEKVDDMAKKMRDEFEDIEKFSEESLKRLWLNKHDEIWNQYLKR